MSKVVRRQGPADPRRPRLPAPTAGRDGRGSYFREVIQELRKTTWPTREELVRMTGIVIATVLIFSALIGVADLGLGAVAQPLYTSSSANPASRPTPQIVSQSPRPASPRSSASARPSATTPSPSR